MASILVSGNAALQANSERHLTASWNESMVATKCRRNIWSGDIMIENGMSLYIHVARPSNKAVETPGSKGTSLNYVHN